MGGEGLPNAEAPPENAPPLPKAEPEPKAEPLLLPPKAPKPPELEEAKAVAGLIHEEVAVEVEAAAGAGLAAGLGDGGGLSSSPGTPPTADSGELRGGELGGDSTPVGFVIAAPRSPRPKESFSLLGEGEGDLAGEAGLPKPAKVGLSSFFSSVFWPNPPNAGLSVFWPNALAPKADWPSVFCPKPLKPNADLSSFFSSFLSSLGSSFFSSGLGCCPKPEKAGLLSLFWPNALCPKALWPKAEPEPNAEFVAGFWPNPEKPAVFEASVFCPNALLPKAEVWPAAAPKALVVVEGEPNADWPKADGEPAGFWPKAVWPNAEAEGVLDWPKAGAGVLLCPNAGAGVLDWPKAGAGDDAGVVLPNPPKAGLAGVVLGVVLPKALAPNAGLAGVLDGVVVPNALWPNADPPVLDPKALEPNALWPAGFWPKLGEPNEGAPAPPNAGLAGLAPGVVEPVPKADWPKADPVAGLPNALWPKAEPALEPNPPNAGFFSGEVATEAAVEGAADVG